MFNSIQHFESKGIKNLRKAEDNFIGQKDLASLESNVKDIVLNFGLNIIAETLENMEFMLCEDREGFLTV